jgi:hypothetical protein
MVNLITVHTTSLALKGCMRGTVTSSKRISTSLFFRTRATVIHNTAYWYRVYTKHEAWLVSMNQPCQQTASKHVCVLPGVTNKHAGYCTNSLPLTVRRKFIRQNREIARINSNQSQRIRELENDCARMLSENLELRSQILHLENELETSHTHRIADHALDVKAKLEAQLSIFSALLEGLGTEPPRKRHSPSTREGTKSNTTSSTSSPARRLRIARDAAAMAQQEGRLPAIPEYKPYQREPRATLK